MPERNHGGEKVRVLVTVAIMAIVLALLFWPREETPVEVMPVKTVRLTKTDGHTVLMESVGDVSSIVNDPQCPKCSLYMQEMYNKAVLQAFDSLDVRIVD